MGRLLEIAKTAFAEIESQDTKKTETERLALNRANAAKTGRLVVEPDERIWPALRRDRPVRLHDLRTFRGGLEGW